MWHQYFLLGTFRKIWKRWARNWNKQEALRSKKKEYTHQSEDDLMVVLVNADNIWKSKQIKTNQKDKMMVKNEVQGMLR